MMSFGVFEKIFIYQPPSNVRFTTPGLNCGRGFDIYESLYVLFYTQTAKFERQAIFTHKAQRLGACGSHIPSLCDPGRNLSVSLNENLVRVPPWRLGLNRSTNVQ